MGAYTCEFGVVHKMCRCPTQHFVKCDKVEEHSQGNGERTETGKWIYKESNIHNCDKPPYDRSVCRGDRWKCNVCNKVWLVEKIDSDQRDGSMWIIWKDLGLTDLGT